MEFNSLCAKDLEKSFRYSPHNMPIYQTSAFEFETHDESVSVFNGDQKGFSYSRYNNPTTESVAEKIAALETHGIDIEAYAYLTNSGMSAITAIVNSLCSQGDIILTQNTLYGGTIELFQKPIMRSGIETIFTDFSSLENIRKIISENPKIKLVYIESPTNPTLEIVDLKGITDLAKQYNIFTVTDNTLNTPYLLQPFKFGIDFIIHSTTKYLSGHGHSTGGVVVGKDKSFKKILWENIKLLGLNPSPFDSWLLYNGLKTLALRMKEQCTNAEIITRFLEEHQKVKRVNSLYLKSFRHAPLVQKQYKNGYGALLSFEIAAESNRISHFFNNLKFCKIVPTLGDLDTILLHPATSSHLKVDKEIREKNGINDNLIRISVGIEDVNDIINDLKNALSWV